ncbi:MAG: DUF2911 domain-containing protein [Gemmatimonadales bacterium]
MSGFKSFPCLLALGSALSVAACQPASDKRAYVEKLGDDTTAVEVFSRTDTSVVGDLVVRSPTTRVAHYAGRLTPDGAISELEVEWHTPETNADGPPDERFMVKMEGDSAIVERYRKDGTDTIKVATPEGTIPVIGRAPMSYGLREQVVRQALAKGGDSVAITLLPAGSQRTRANYVAKVGSDTVAMSFFGSRMLASVTSSGDLLGITGKETTMQVEGTRAAGVDLEALAEDFAARDASGKGFGVASPGATLQTTLADAHLEIKYSQPAKRGRDLFGGLVPWNKVWRTGANAATIFTTDRDLEIGGKTVPAGSYTLWSTYTPESAQLIINSETGQWGTAYDESKDFVRVDMTRSSLSEPVERFTFAVESDGSGGMLQLKWGDTQFSVPIVVK